MDVVLDDRSGRPEDAWELDETARGGGRNNK